MSIEFHDPRAEPVTPDEPYELGTDPAAGPVALLANGFPDSVAFLDHVADAVGGQVPGVEFRRFDKGNASAVASDEMLDAIVAECRSVVAAYGH